MALYTVRVNIDDVKLLNFIDFTDISKGILKLKTTHNTPSGEIDRVKLIWKGLKIETFINGSPSVGMVFLCKEFFNSHPNLQFKKSMISNPIEGTVDNFAVTICSDQGKLKVNEIKFGENILFIRFVTKRYHEALIGKSSDGISSQQVDIQVFVNGKFKPYSQEQASIHGLQVVTSTHTNGCRFYDREYIGFLENNFDDEGNELETPKVQACDWIPCYL